MDVLEKSLNTREEPPSKKQRVFAVIDGREYGHEDDHHFTEFTSAAIDDLESYDMDIHWEDSSLEEEEKSTFDVEGLLGNCVCPTLSENQF